MKRSEQCDQLYTALALARANFGKAERTKEAKIKGKSRTSGESFEYSYKYAPLEECFKAIDQALSDQGLALVGGVEYSADGQLWVITHLGHTSGQWIENALNCGIPQDDKDMGGKITYARRYGVTLTVQMHAEDDDDGPRGGESYQDRRQAKKPTPKPMAAPETPAPLPTTKPTGEEVSQLMELLRGTYPNEKTVETQVRALLTTLPPNVAFEDRRVKMLMTRDAYTRLQDAATAYALEHANPDDDVPITPGPDAPESPETHEPTIGEEGDSLDTTELNTEAASTAEEVLTSDVITQEVSTPDSGLASSAEVKRVGLYADRHDLGNDFMQSMNHYPNGIPQARLDEIEQRLKDRVTAKKAAKV